MVNVFYNFGANIAVIPLWSTKLIINVKATTSNALKVTMSIYYWLLVL